jgi:hypothetical protein
LRIQDYIGEGLNSIEQEDIELRINQSSGAEEILLAELNSQKHH